MLEPVSSTVNHNHNLKEMTTYPVAAEAMDLEIYVLAALICGSESMRGIEGELRGIAWVRSTFEASEVSRRIISLAVMLRSHLDSSGIRFDTEVGSLTPDVEAPSNREPLLFREACNKIIHADEVDIHGGTFQSEEETKSLSRHARLFGSLRGTDWIAEVDMLRFLNAASNHS